MKSLDQFSPEEWKEMHSEAMLLYLVVQVKVLSEALDRVAASCTARFDGATFSQWQHAQQDLQFRELLRKMADTDISRASAIAQHYENRKKGRCE
jgi:hypothetical protein